MPTKVFLVGPGYVGREIIDLLLADGGYEVTTLCRRESAAKEFQKDGIKTQIGDLDDHDTISRIAAESDVVFHTATADHLPSAQAILDGIEKRAAEGKRTIYLHQSGASVLSDGSGCSTLNEHIYSDARPEEIDALADNAPHRSIDLAILKVRKSLGDKARIFIMMPPIIYGINKKYGRTSIQVGEGKSAWGTIHVKDQAQAYVVILKAIEQGSKDLDLSNPYFFCESGETSWAELASVIGEGLHKAGKVDSANARSIPEDAYADLFGKFTPDVVGCNARNRAERLPGLGWTPKQLSVKDAFEQEELPVLLNEKEFKSSGLALS